MRVKFQSDWQRLNQNLASLRFARSPDINYWLLLLLILWNRPRHCIHSICKVSQRIACHLFIFWTTNSLQYELINWRIKRINTKALYHWPTALMITSSNGNTFRVTGPLVRGNHRSPVNSPHKGQWRGALMFSLICAWINGWVNNREAGDLRRRRLQTSKSHQSNHNCWHQPKPMGN